MITFVAIIQVISGDEYPLLYKDIEWPVLPRGGEHFELIDGVYQKVDLVWHVRKEDESPEIQLYFDIRREDYEDYEEAGWKPR